MAAACWAHALGVAVVVEDGPGIPDPLGACFGCSVFDCAGHAERDRGAGKWICFQCVARTAAASTGVGKSVGVPKITGHAQFLRRFPNLATATRGHRQEAFNLLISRDITPASGDLHLLADAVGVAHALTANDAPSSRHSEHVTKMDESAIAGSGTFQAAEESQSSAASMLFTGPFGKFLSNLEP